MECIVESLQTVFSGVKTILVIDWPSKEVPEVLALAGFAVVVRGGPEPTDYSSYKAEGGLVVKHHIGRAPERAELVYSYRPLSELDGIIDIAKTLHAHTIWTQSGLSADGKQDPKGCWVPQGELEQARELAQSAGFNHISEPYIVEYIRRFHVAH
jgi:predicted CoA-binding protein